jgi:hypothetical protein
MRASANVEFTPEQQATIKAGNPHGHEVSGPEAAANVSRNLLSDHLPGARCNGLGSALLQGVGLFRAQKQNPNRFRDWGFGI